jgi:hypothetical protein
MDQMGGVKVYGIAYAIAEQRLMLCQAIFVVGTQKAVAA